MNERRNDKMKKNELTKKRTKKSRKGGMNNKMNEGTNKEMN